MSLIPMKYPIGGCIVLGILFLFSMQQVCISAISDRPRIFYRCLGSIYCMNVWILSCILISHYHRPHDVKLITTVRLFTAWIIICNSIILLNVAYRSIDAAYKSRAEKPDSAPKWFATMTKFVLFLHTVVIIFCYCFAYMFNDAIFITYYYLFLDILFIAVCVGVFIPITSLFVGLNKIIKLGKNSLSHINHLNDKTFEEQMISKQLSINIRKRIKQEIQRKDSQFVYDQIEHNKNMKIERKASMPVIKMLTNTENIMTIQRVEQINKAISSEQSDAISLKKLQRVQRSMIIAIIFLCASCIYTVYHLIIHLLNTNFTATLPLNVSPWPTVFSHLGHFGFDFTVDLVLIMSTYKQSDCCCAIAPNSFMYICCPLLRRKGSSEKHFKNEIIDINGNPLQVVVNTSKQNDEETLRTEIAEAQNSPNLECRGSLTTSTLLELAGNSLQKVQSVNDEVAVVIYNLENAFLSPQNSIHLMMDMDDYQQIIAAFGGRNKVKLIKDHLDSVVALNVKCFLISRKPCDLIRILLQSVGLLKYFVSDDAVISDRIIGINHLLLRRETNHKYSLTEILLKIIANCGCVNDSVLYIDNDGNTANVEKINLCRTYGIKTRHGLQLYDIKAIEKKYFV